MKRKLNTIHHEIVQFLKKNNCVTLLGMSGIGKIEFTRAIAESLQSSHIVIEVDSNDLTSINEVDFLKSILFKLHRLVIADPKLSLLSETLRDALLSDNSFIIMNNIKEAIKLLLSEDQYDGVIIIFRAITKVRSLGSVFFSSLKTLLRVSGDRVGFFFVDKTSLTYKLNEESVGELMECMNLMVYWLPLPSYEVYLEAISKSENRYNVALSDREKKRIFELTAGHGGLSKYLAFYLKKHTFEDLTAENAILFQPIKLRLDRILNELSESESTALFTHRKIGVMEQDAYESLVQKGILKSNDKEITYTIPLLEKYICSLDQIQNSSKREKGAIEIRNGEAIVNGVKIKEELSLREFNLLSFLIDHKGRIVSRESVADIIWGNQQGEKYSDWAIDQTVSRLRKKLGDNGYKPQHLLTIRGRGFKLRDEGKKLTSRVNQMS